MELEEETKEAHKKLDSEGFKNKNFLFHAIIVKVDP